MTEEFRVLKLIAECDLSKPAYKELQRLLAEHAEYKRELVEETRTADKLEEELLTALAEVVEEKKRGDGWADTAVRLFSALTDIEYREIPIASEIASKALHGLHHDTRVDLLVGTDDPDNVPPETE